LELSILVFFSFIYMHTSIHLWSINAISFWLPLYTILFVTFLTWPFGIYSCYSSYSNNGVFFSPLVVVQLVIRKQISLWNFLIGNWKELQAKLVL
jgi:hypothetical protein